MLFGYGLSLQSQVITGTLLFTLLLWQLLTGLRVIKLGRKHYRIHRITGITLVILTLGHGLTGYMITFGWSIG